MTLPPFQKGDPKGHHAPSVVVMPSKLPVLHFECRFFCINDHFLLRPLAIGKADTLVQAAFRYREIRRLGRAITGRSKQIGFS